MTENTWPYTVSLYPDYFNIRMVNWNNEQSVAVSRWLAIYYVTTNENVQLHGSAARPARGGLSGQTQSDPPLAQVGLARIL